MDNLHMPVYVHCLMRFVNNGSELPTLRFAVLGTFPDVDIEIIIVIISFRTFFCLFGINRNHVPCFNNIRKRLWKGENDVKSTGGGGLISVVVIRQFFVQPGGDGSLVESHMNINKEAREHKYWFSTRVLHFNVDSHSGLNLQKEFRMETQNIGLIKINILEYWLSVNWLFDLESHVPRYVQYLFGTTHAN
jgi:hypothetical protein